MVSTLPCQESVLHICNQHPAHVFAGDRAKKQVSERVCIEAVFVCTWEEKHVMAVFLPWRVNIHERSRQHSTRRLEEQRPVKGSLQV